MLLLSLAGAASANVLTIEGLQDDALANARAYSGFLQESCDSPEWRLRALHERAPQQIREALEVFGYYEAEIEAEQELVDGCLQARYRVTPGDPVRYATAQVELRGPGSEARYWQPLLDSSPLVVGEPLLHSAYERFKQRLSDRARRYGHFDARFERAEVQVYPDEGTAAVYLVFVPGPRYRVGEVQLDQQVVEDSLVRRFVDMETGQLFDADELGELYTAMLVTGYFSSVEVQPMPRRDGSAIVDVTLTASAAKASTWTVGVGFGTDTGPQARLAYFNRRLNDKGHQWGASASASPVVKQAGLEYRIPLRQPRAEWLSFEGGYKDEDVETLQSRQLKFGIRRLQLRGTRWLETQFLDVTRDDFSVAGEQGRNFYIAPGISWSLVSSSAAARPTSGYRFSLQFSGTTEAIGSDLSFLQTLVSAKAIAPLPWGIRLLARLDVGATMVDQPQDLPGSLRFFAGGDFSVRGYDYKTLGPLDAEGEVRGGSNLLTGSLELDRLVTDNWALAAFVDGGNAFNSFGNRDFQLAAGGGVRWFSPVGPIRLDIAVPLSDRKRDNFRLHVTLSPDL